MKDVLIAAALLASVAVLLRLPAIVDAIRLVFNASKKVHVHPASERRAVYKNGLAFALLLALGLGLALSLVLG